LPNYNRKLYFGLQKHIKKNYRAGTLGYLAALVGSLDDCRYLSYEKITLADYRSLVEILKEMSDFGGGVDFISGALKAFFERHGFAVTPDCDSVGWHVTYA
jgi:hypothetical protein